MVVFSSCMTKESLGLAVFTFLFVSAAFVASACASASSAASTAATTGILVSLVVEKWGKGQCGILLEGIGFLQYVC